MKWGPLLSYKLSDPGKLSPHDSMNFALSPKLAPKFFSLFKIHTMFYTLIKFHKCFIDDNFWMGFCFSWEETLSLILINSPKFRNTIITLQSRITIYISPLISNSYSYFHFRQGTDMQLLLNEIPMHWSSWSLPNTDPIQLPYLCLSHQWCIGTLLLITSAPINRLPIQFCLLWLLENI